MLSPLPYPEARDLSDEGNQAELYPKGPYWSIRFCRYILCEDFIRIVLAGLLERQ